MSTPVSAAVPTAPAPASDIPLASEQITKMLSSLDANQIEAIAKHIVASVMSRLSIDVIRNQPIAGLFNVCVDGSQFPVRLDKYDPESRLMKALLPLITKEIADAFARSPAPDFKIRFILATPSKEGLLDTITDEYLKPRVSQGIAGIIASFNLNTLRWEMELSLNPEYTNERRGLSFSINKWMNGALVGNSGGSIQYFEESVAHSTT